MVKLTKLRNGDIILNINNTLINVKFNDNKIWLTKREIANMFWVEKNIIKENLLKMQTNSIYDYNKNSKRIFNISTKKEKVYYSIDLIISLGYRLNNFTATKLLIKINRTLKNLWINRKSILKIIKESLEKISIESYFAKKYILNL